MKWQTVTLATFVAATVPVEKAGDVNPVMEAAHKLAETLDADNDKKQIPKMGPPVLDFDPENPPIPDVPAGSFERFMGSMGSPAKWAGR